MGLILLAARSQVASHAHDVHSFSIGPVPLHVFLVTLSLRVDDAP